jgi:hypothetical protein
MVCRASYVDGKLLFPRTPDFGNSFEVVESIKGSFVESKGLAGARLPTLAEV